MLTEAEERVLRGPKPGATLDEYAEELTRIRNNARSVLLSTLQAEQIAEESPVYRLPDKSLATLQRDGSVVFWGKP